MKQRFASLQTTPSLKKTFIRIMTFREGPRTQSSDKHPLFVIVFTEHLR